MNVLNLIDVYYSTTVPMADLLGLIDLLLDLHSIWIITFVIILYLLVLNRVQTSDVIFGKKKFYNIIEALFYTKQESYC